MVSVDGAFGALSSVASAAAETAPGGGGIAAFFREGGIFMYFNLVISAVVIAIVIERTIFQLTKYRVNSKEFFAQVRKLVNANNLVDADALQVGQALRLPDGSLAVDRAAPSSRGNRVEAPAVVVGTRCDVGDCGHGGNFTVPGGGQPVPDEAGLGCFLMNRGGF